MSHAGFVPLRVHSAYSLAEGAIKIPDLITRCKKDRVPAIALTDTGNLFGALEFSRTASSEGIQPIIGCQLSVAWRAEDPRHQETRLPGVLSQRDQLIFLVQNENGYQNLMKLVSQSYQKHPHEPYIPFEWLQDFQEGLIVLSGGMGGGGAKLLLQGQSQAASAFFQGLAALFPGRFYIEITRHGWEDQREQRIENSLLQLAYALNLPLVATNEAFFLDPALYEAHDALLCVAAGAYVSEQDRRRVTPQHRLRPPREMAELFQDLPEALENTVRLAQRCAFMVESRAPMLPPFPSERSEPEELAFQARKGLEQRLQNQIFASSSLTEEEKQGTRQKYSERLEREIEIISSMGYAGYYLIVADFIQWAKNQGIPVGPGRGSGAGSLVAWALTITDIDPIRFGLLFERFLNPERVSMPDFDVDFCQDRRDEVIAYVQEKYGHDRVAQISAFGKMQARAVLRDIGRVLGMPYGQVDRLSKMIPNNPTHPVTLHQAFEQDPQLQEMAREDATVQRLLDMAMKLEGLYRHVSTHAAGIVIGDRPLDELIPLYYDGKSRLPATQFNMKDVESAGLVKLDLLGLKTLTIIRKTIELLKARAIDINISTIPLDDQKTFAHLRGRETMLGIFQVESAGMRDVLHRMQPQRFEELIALVALYRPGPMDDIPRYLACKHGQEPVNYGHPLIEDILKETYGVMVYQEQVMQIAQVMGGYTLGAADLLRRAMGKKIKSEMDAQRQIFVEGAEKKGVSTILASQIFDQMAKFAGYGFNKCHSGPYALITYQTAYLKANYPVEFMASTMSYDMNNTDKLNMYWAELNRLKIPLLTPDINQSFGEFQVEKTEEGTPGIRYALAAVKNVGEGAMKELVQEREQRGPFKDIIDFACRLSSQVINKRMLENLICAGAFDCLNPHRAQLLHSVDLILKYVGQNCSQEKKPQNTLFGAPGTHSLPSVKFPDVSSWSSLESLHHELEAVGFYLSAHPLNAYGGVLEKFRLTPSSLLQDMCARQENMSVTLAGVMMNKKERLSKNGSRFAFATFSDPSGIFEVALFSEVYAQYRDQLQAGATMVMKVSARLEGDTLRLTVNSLEDLNKALERQASGLEIHLKDQAAFTPLKTILEKADKGASPIKLIFKLKGKKVCLKLSQAYHVTPGVRESIGAISGIESLRDV